LPGPARRAGQQTKIKRMTFRPDSNDEKETVTTRPKIPLLALSACFVLLGVLGCLDYVTGYEMSFFVFYSVPVGVAAWYVGRWPAIGLALAATVTWLLADYLSGAKYSSPFFYYWNSVIHFAAFIINAVTIAKIKSDLDRRHTLAVELEATRESLRALAAQIPVCPACGKPRNGAGNNVEAEMVTLARKHPELVDLLCAECMANGMKVAETAGCSASSLARPFDHEDEDD
jgi:hypothetical protein